MDNKQIKENIENAKRAFVASRNQQRSISEVNKFSENDRQTTEANIQKDIKLYEIIKNKVYNKYPRHSAYRSGILVKEYKKAYFKKYKSNEAYNGKTPTKKGLS